MVGVNKNGSNVHVIRVINDHKKRSGATGYPFVWKRPAPGMKRVMAICGSARNPYTAHVDVEK